MIPVPEAYLAAIRAPVRTDRIGGVLTLPGGINHIDSGRFYKRHPHD